MREFRDPRSKALLFAPEPHEIEMHTRLKDAESKVEKLTKLLTEVLREVGRRDLEEVAKELL